MSKESFKKHLEETGEVGYVIHSSNPIIYVSGLPSLKKGEAVITENGERGVVFGMDRKKAEVLMFETGEIRGGERVARTNDLFHIEVCDSLLGRVVNPLCLPVDGLGPISGKKTSLPLEREAPGITKRELVNRPFETGVTIVDLLSPLGYGQREMVVGDAKTGKTTFLLQAICNQAKKGVICVYVGIGKESSALKEVESYLREKDVSEKVVMMITPSNEPSTLHYIAPFAGVTVAEYFRDKGEDVFLIFDDLSNHAKAYREISLLLKNPPGREAYPGDVFHIHASIVERAGNIKIAHDKVASITMLPVAETLENDISGFIQTNLLSMTDGHIFFDINELKKGRYPAVNTFLSVSRVGNQTRGSLDKDLVGKIEERLVEYRKTLEVAQFGAELGKEKQKALEFGQKMEMLLAQDTKTVVSRPMQIFLFGLLFSGFWKDASQKAIKKEIQKILDNVQGELFREIEQRIDGMKNAEELKDFCEEKASMLESFL